MCLSVHLGLSTRRPCLLIAWYVAMNNSWVTHMLKSFLTRSSILHCQETVWSTDGFNARKGNQLTEACLRVPSESHIIADSKTLLNIIDKYKLLLAGKMISTAINGSWIGYANAMGLEYYKYKLTKSCQILTFHDLRLALKQLNLRKCLAAVYFVTGYATREDALPRHR
jgi:hypothetical protein